MKCNLTGNKCYQHTGLQCSGESEDCYWKENEDEGYGEETK